MWWSLQPFLDDEDSNPKQGEARRKQLMVAQGTDRAFTLARRLGIKVAFGTDILFNPGGVPRHNAQLVKLSRWFSPAQVLAIATGGNGELLARSGERSTYRGALGVIAPDALADLILVDGDPLEDLALIADPVRNFLVIVKDGVVVKDALTDGAAPATSSP